MLRPKVSDARSRGPADGPAAAAAARALRRPGQQQQAAGDGQPDQDAQDAACQTCFAYASIRRPPGTSPAAARGRSPSRRRRVQETGLHPARRPATPSRPARAEPLTSAPSMMPRRRRSRTACRGTRAARDDLLVEPVEVVLVDQQRVEPAQRCRIASAQAGLAQIQVPGREHPGQRQPEPGAENACSTNAQGPWNSLGQLAKDVMCRSLTKMAARRNRRTARRRSSASR